MKRSGYHIMLAVPTRGQVCWQTVTALEAARDRTPGLRPILYEAGNLSVAQTRNRIVEKFFATDCSTLVMVDDDVAPPVEFLAMIDPLLDEFAVVSIPHAMPHPDGQDPGALILSAYDVDERDGGWLRPVSMLRDGANECDAVATGCVAIRRDALELLGRAPFRIDSDPSAVLTSDDFLFCADVRELGLRVGFYWDGHPVDHFKQINLAPLARAQLIVHERS